MLQMELTTTVDLELGHYVKIIAEHWNVPREQALRVLIKVGVDVATTQAVCRRCGCTYSTPCDVGGGETCHWVRDDLCSACSPVIEHDTVSSP